MATKAKDLTKCSNEGVEWIDLVLRHHVEDMINDGDLRQVRRQFIDICSAERADAIQKIQRVRKAQTR